MRILFAFVEGVGHYNPLVPLARAAEAAGHTVAFAANPNRVDLPRADGFETHVAGITPGSTPESDLFERRYDTLPPGQDREDLITREGFADAYARPTVDDLLRLSADWRPDVLVWDDVNLGAPVAAERAGLPHVAVQVIAAGKLLRRSVIGERLAAVRRDLGLPGGMGEAGIDEAMAMLGRHLTLVPFPAGFRDPAADPLPSTARHVRPLLPGAQPGETAPDWLRGLPPDRPLVYVSLGTAFGSLAVEVFRRILPPLAALPISLAVTTGRSIDPTDLGALPANVHIERYVSQSLLLPRTALAVSHAGSGSVMGALSHGVPLALIPRGADQPDNARRCEALGVGQIIGDPDVPGDEVARVVGEMLADTSWRQAATRIRDSIAASPDADAAIRMIVEVATTHRRADAEPGPTTA